MQRAPAVPHRRGRRPTALSVSAEPALFPAFDRDVSDYVTRCGERPCRVRRRGAAGHRRVRRRGGPAQRPLQRERPARRRPARRDHGHRRGAPRPSTFAACRPTSRPGPTCEAASPARDLPSSASRWACRRRSYVVLFDGRACPSGGTGPQRASCRSTPSCCRTTASRSPSGASAASPPTPRSSTRSAALTALSCAQSRQSACPPTSTSCRSCRTATTWWWPTSHAITSI